MPFLHGALEAEGVRSNANQLWSIKREYDDASKYHGYERAVFRFSQNTDINGATQVEAAFMLKSGDLVVLWFLNGDAEKLGVLNREKIKHSPGKTITTQVYSPDMVFSLRRVPPIKELVNRSLDWQFVNHGGYIYRRTVFVHPLTERVMSFLSYNTHDGSLWLQASWDVPEEGIWIFGNAGSSVWTTLKREALLGRTETFIFRDANMDVTVRLHPDLSRWDYQGHRSY